MSLNGAILGMSAYRRFAVSSSTLISTSVNISNCRCSTSLQLCKSPFVVSTRTVSSGGFPFKRKLFFDSHNVWRCSRLRSSSQPSQKRLLEEPDETDPHVIYKGLLSDQMKRLKIFSLTTSGMGLLMQPILIEKSSQVSVGANVAVFGMVGFFTFVTPFLIHAIAKKYVTEIIYDPAKDQYKATAFTFFLRKNEVLTLTFHNSKIQKVFHVVCMIVVVTNHYIFICCRFHLQSTISMLPMFLDHSQH